MTHIERVDLNLLVPLAALLEERHVSRAAERVRLSQPAMSRALQRLRAALGDELVVRGAQGYQLTPRAERLHGQLRSLLPQLEDMFSDAAFDPGTAAEVFRITGTDYASTVLGPALFQRLFQQSPDSRLTFRAWHDDAIGDLARGLTDLVLTAVPAPPTLCAQQLLEERYLCLLSAGHPLAGRTSLSLDEYLSCSHVEVTVVEGRQGLLDQRISALAAPRRVSLSVPHHAVAPLAIPGTRLVATLPCRLVAHHLSDPRLRCLRAPREIESMRPTAWSGTRAWTTTPPRTGCVQPSAPSRPNCPPHRHLDGSTSDRRPGCAPHGIGCAQRPIELAVHQGDLQMACSCSGSMLRRRMHAPGRHPRVRGPCRATPLDGTRSMKWAPVGSTSRKAGGASSARLP